MKRCKILSIMLLLTLIFSTVTPNVYAAKKKIAISNKKITIEVGETHQLSVTGTKATVSWISADESIATVADDGTVTGMAEGITKITGKIGNKKYSCKVTVEFHNYKTLTFATNEYSEWVAGAVSLKGKNVNVDIDDEFVTITAPEEEFERIDKKIMKEYSRLVSGFYRLEYDGATFDFYEIQKYNQQAYDQLINCSMSLVAHAYLNGYTEKDIVINIHKMNIDKEAILRNDYSNITYGETITISMPTYEEIFKNSDPDC